MTPHGYFHWNELMTRDAEAAKTFYFECVGWDFSEMNTGEGPSYWVAMSGENPVAGIFTMEGENFEGMPEHWMSYVAVDDIDAAAEQAGANGGTVVQAPFDVPGVGRIAIIRQPGGAMVGWMTPAGDG